MILLCLGSSAGAQVGSSVNDTSILFDGSIAPVNVTIGDMNDATFCCWRSAEDFSFPGPVIVSGITFLGGYNPDVPPNADSNRCDSTT